MNHPTQQPSITPFKQAVARYFNTWWIPSSIYLGLLALLMVFAMLELKFPNIIERFITLILLITLHGVLLVGLVHLLKKHWKKALIQGLLYGIFGFTSICAIAFLMFQSMFGPSEDGFADNLTIPTDITIEIPSDNFATVSQESDIFQRTLLQSLGDNDNAPNKVTAHVTALKNLGNNHPDLLKRYLASSPFWRVYRENGNLFATRRWIIENQWHYELHGYYSQHDLDSFSDSETPDFQSRFSIGLTGNPWISSPSWFDSLISSPKNNNLTQLTPNESKKLILTKKNSHISAEKFLPARNLRHPHLL